MLNKFAKVFTYLKRINHMLKEIDVKFVHVIRQKKNLKLIIPACLILIAVVAYLFVCSFSQNPSIGKNKPIQFIFPKGGETLVKGNTYTIRYQGGSQAISIYLVSQVIEPNKITASIKDRIYDIKNTGSYTYQVPQKLDNGAYRLIIGDDMSSDFLVTSR